jgi:hypothetical protein
LEDGLAEESAPEKSALPPVGEYPIIPVTEIPEAPGAPAFPPPVEPTPILPGLDDGAPLGPTAEEESAFLAESRERPVVVARTAPVEAAETSERGSLPVLADLVQRLSPEVRDTLEELFRAKFIAVRRVPKHAIKT